MRGSSRLLKPLPGWRRFATTAMEIRQRILMRTDFQTCRSRPCLRGLRRQRDTGPGDHAHQRTNCRPPKRLADRELVVGPLNWKNHPALGARATVTTGDRQQVKPVLGGGSYLSTSDLSLLFGLGASHSIDSLEVHWPSGRVQRMTHVTSGQHLAIVEATDTAR
jgi:hypothetical protein